jgi:DNA-binding transcriptional ArsR family regulator
MKPQDSNDSLAMMERNASKAEAMLKSLANAKRLMILCHLVKSEHTVSELADLVGLSHSALSQHLAKMKENELVVSDKRGQHVFYRIASPEVGAILSTLYLIYCRE